MLALFAVGIGVGSVLAERLLHGEVSARFVPIAALAMARRSPSICISRAAGRTATATLIGVGDVRARAPAAGASSADLLGLAAAGGLFRVPLYALLQHESEPAHRARVIAANNIVNALVMTAGAVVAAALLAPRLTMASDLRAVRARHARRSALAAAWVLRRHVAEDAVRLVLRAPVSRRGRGTRARARGVAARGHCRQPRVVSRRPAARRVPARRADLRGRHATSRGSGGPGRSWRWSTRCRSTRPIRCRSAR